MLANITGRDIIYGQLLQQVKQLNHDDIVEARQK